jgi:hypothetical protein
MGRSHRFGSLGLLHPAGLMTLVLLNRTAISDAGLAYLAVLTGCGSISLKETATTEAGIGELSAKLPGIEIER